MKNVKGYLKGDICNRNGCIGIIDKHDSENECRCHINPPCSYCTTSREYCPECDWDGGEEQREVYEQNSKEHQKLEEARKAKGEKSWYDQMRDYQDDFNNRWRSKEYKPEKLEWIPESHTHFSMIKRGMYPEGMSKKEVLEKVKGTFGGRFTSFGNGRFNYIAYTD